MGEHIHLHPASIVISRSIGNDSPLFGSLPLLILLYFASSTGTTASVLVGSVNPKLQYVFLYSASATFFSHPLIECGHIEFWVM